MKEVSVEIKERQMNADLQLESTAKKQYPVFDELDEESVQFLEPAIIYSTSKPILT